MNNYGFRPDRAQIMKEWIYIILVMLGFLFSVIGTVALALSIPFSIPIAFIGTTLLAGGIMLIVAGLFKMWCLS